MKRIDTTDLRVAFEMADDYVGQLEGIDPDTATEEMREGRYDAANRAEAAAWGAAVVVALTADEARTLRRVVEYAVPQWEDWLDAAQSGIVPEELENVTGYTAEETQDMIDTADQARHLLGGDWDR